MASINYDDVFNQFLGEVTDHKLMSLCDSDAYELMVGWLHKALSNPLIKKTYSLLTFDDAIQKITYELKVSDGGASDKLFTIEILGNEMAYIWANTQVMSDVNTEQFYGGKEQKYYSQANHITALRELKSDCLCDVRRKIGDRGISVNTYLGGRS